MSLRALLLDLGRERGVTIDEDDLDSIGLSDDEDRPRERGSEDLGDALAQTLPGSAIGLAEVFLEAPRGKAIERDGLLWSPVAMSGQWALRPDGRGGKVHSPLRVVAGKSSNPRRQIGIQDIFDAFNDEAIEDVTIPQTHGNGPLENTGFVEKLAIVDGKSRQGKSVKVLMAGQQFTDPVARQKTADGSSRGRSMGLLYDYERTDTGKRYPVVLEHLALTPKPWLRGMPRLARALSSPHEISTVSLSLSDAGPSDDEGWLALDDGASGDFLADDDEQAIRWSHEDSPNWLRQQVDDVLQQARKDKVVRRRTPAGCLVEDAIPTYRCVEAKPGSALIADGWGDGANYWVVAVSVSDGVVSLPEFSAWTATKQVWVSDEREQPEGDLAPLSDADEDRSTKQDPTRGGGEMAGQTGALQLSDEARALIKAAEDRAMAAEQRAEGLSETVDKLFATSKTNEAAAYIGHMKARVEDGGLGLSEERGFGGMLLEVEALMLADAGSVAVESDHFADDSNQKGELTLTAAIKRVFGALRTAEGSTLKLAEVVQQPASRIEEKAGGKPPSGDDEVDEAMLSDDEILSLVYEQSSSFMDAAGIKVEAKAS